MTHRPVHAARVVVISASVGAGHDAAADEITRRLGPAGAVVDRHDFLALMPSKVGRMLRDSYQRMLSSAPWSYRLLYGALDRSSALSFQVAVFSNLAVKHVLAAIPADADLVVSTYPLTSQVLGRLRRSGQAAAQGAAGVRVTAPVVDPRFGPADPDARDRARARFGLPPRGRIALLVGGSWGAGEIDAAVREIDATRIAACAVVCGRNEELRARLLAAGVRHVFGWVQDMPALLHAVDVLVQNAGGMTVLEAVRSELPVVAYRCIPGHGLTNSQALEEAKIAPWARQPEDLHRVLATALATVPNAHVGLFRAADPIDTLLAVAAQAADGGEAASVVGTAVSAPAVGASSAAAAPAAAPATAAPAPASAVVPAQRSRLGNRWNPVRRAVGQAAGERRPQDQVQDLFKEAV